MTTVELLDRRECPLCRSKQASVHIPFPDVPVVRCDSCDFMYSKRVLSETALEHYYEDNFGSERHKKGQLVNSKVNAMALGKILDFSSVRRVLDVGTGYGFLLRELNRKYKLDAVGVELSKQEAEHAQRELSLKVINEKLADTGLAKQSFDLVTSFEVIEHVPRPGEFIQELTDYVKPGGHLLIMTDNFDSRMAKSLGPGFPKWIPHSHISHFSAETLKRTLAANENLRLVASRSYTPWEVLLRNLVYKLLGIRKTPEAVFDLETVLQEEMRGKYKLFTIRRLVNHFWVKLTISPQMDGDLIYFLCVKEPQSRIG